MIRVMLPGGQQVTAWLAISPQARRKGLVGRVSLGPDQAMLFVHPESGYHRYWMKDVLMPLDMAWLNSNLKIVEIVHDAQPGNMTALGGHCRAKYVLEIAGGMAKQYGLQPGQRIQLAKQAEAA